MADSDIWKLSACDQAERIAAGDMSAREAVGASIDRMQDRNPAMNAVVDDLSEQALAQAAKLDGRFAKSGPVGPLHGVPVTIKENIDQEGRATPNGVAGFKDLIGPADSPFVTNLKNAGAVVIGRTNTPEFSFRGTTDNPLHGRTFNPWNDWASAGGSSGGASSAVMSGMGAIAHGNDIGGSLRFPATCTGAATVKPGLGRTPAYNPSQVAERGILAQISSVQGVICREVRDVRLAMKSAIGYSPTDPWQVPMPWEGPQVEGPIKVGITRETYGFDMDPAVDQALTNAAEALKDAGYLVEEIKTPDVFEIGTEGTRTLFGETKAMMLAVMREHGSPEFNTYFDHCFDIAPPYEGDALLTAYAKRAMYVRQWLGLLAETPLVLTPFLLSPTYAHARDYEGREGAEEIMLKGFYSFAMNFMGLPAGNVPANYNDGLPVGVQIVGRRFREDLILDACEAVEARVGVMAERLFERG
ncbi:Amidase [Sulfitobacter noctilucicola]|uniref:Amidase n=1 Tax=Sulfitobacter noctilucicola TaxID=1342301 RepID=A0A7W6M5G5_9RHOB|nr:amidase family protein [Sulfitobacter noctilucicola]KIN62731.1 Amidase [Sulfitobacter noctilucicola]MBB4172736.1 amidase [Sulfitobacter noctilucicola]